MRLMLTLGGLIGMAALLSVSSSAEAKISTNKISTNKISTNKISTNSLAGNRLIGGGAVTDVSGIELPNGVRITR
jgi:hypothetical protein